MRHTVIGLLLALTAATLLSPGIARAQAPGVRVAEARPGRTTGDDPLADLPQDHPLIPALRYALRAMHDLEKVEDYSCTMVKRERIDGVLGEHQYFSVKVRHNPFSVYMYFLTPEDQKGQEVIWVQGENDGKMWAHPVGVRARLVGTISLDPRGRLAMQGNRYPLTEVGMLNLSRRLIEVASADTQYGECEVKFFEGAKINGRTCTCIQAVHPVPRKEFSFHLAQIFIDDELKVPVRYVAYTWPEQEGGEPVLQEEYTYLDVKLNNGFTDIDFSIKNPNYNFK
jgi:hypothetical protein